MNKYIFIILGNNKMDITTLSKYLDDKYTNYDFTIYPFTSNDGLKSVGSIIPPLDQWNRIELKLSKSKCCSVKKSVYIYHDIELHISEEENKVFQRNVKHYEICKNFLVIISDDLILDMDSFPKINKYDNEYSINMKTYKFGSISLSLVKSENGNYIEIKFKLDSKNSLNLINDINYINKLLQ